MRKRLPTYLSMGFGDFVDMMALRTDGGDR